MEIFQTATGDFPLYLANQLVVLVGDSNDRNAVKHLCQFSYNATLTRASLGQGEIVNEGGCWFC